MGIYGANYGANYEVVYTPESVLAGEIKPRLNISTDNSRSDVKISSFATESESHIINQIALHDSSITIFDDPILFSLGGIYAALRIKQFTTPIVIKRLLKVDKNIQDYINAKYGKYNANGLRGDDTFGVTSAITGDF